jgi:pyruvate kinase
VHTTKENGIHIVRSDMGVDIKFGAMVVFMKDIGKLIRPTAAVDSYTLMATSMMVTGAMTRRMALVSTPTRMAQNTKAIG